MKDVSIVMQLNESLLVLSKLILLFSSMMTRLPLIRICCKPSQLKIILTLTCGIRALNYIGDIYSAA